VPPFRRDDIIYLSVFATFNGGKLTQPSFSQILEAPFSRLKKDYQPPKLDNTAHAMYL